MIIAATLPYTRGEDQPVSMSVTPSLSQSRQHPPSARPVSTSADCIMHPLTRPVGQSLHRTSADRYTFKQFVKLLSRKPLRHSLNPMPVVRPPIRSLNLFFSRRGLTGRPPRLSRTPGAVASVPAHLSGRCSHSDTDHISAESARCLLAVGFVG